MWYDPYVDDEGCYRCEAMELLERFVKSRYRYHHKSIIENVTQEILIKLLGNEEFLHKETFDRKMKTEARRMIKSTMLDHLGYKKGGLGHIRRKTKGEYEQDLERNTKRNNDLGLEEETKKYVKVVSHIDTTEDNFIDTSKSSVFSPEGLIQSPENAIQYVKLHEELFTEFYRKLKIAVDNIVRSYEAPKKNFIEGLMWGLRTDDTLPEFAAYLGYITTNPSGDFRRSLKKVIKELENNGVDLKNIEIGEGTLLKLEESKNKGLDI